MVSVQGSHPLLAIAALKQAKKSWEMALHEEQMSLPKPEQMDTETKEHDEQEPFNDGLARIVRFRDHCKREDRKTPPKSQR